MIAEQNWFAKNMEHRDTKAQSFLFFERTKFMEKWLALWSLPSSYLFLRGSVPLCSIKNRMNFFAIHF